MRQINLLPWRERRLEAMKRTFVMQTVFTVVVVIFIVLAAHKSLTQRLVKQEGVNRILEQHIADLNTQVTEVDQFRERQAVVRDRMRVIADLQNERASVVKMLDGLVRSLPSEVYFLTLERVDDAILIEGVSESYLGITELMRRLEDSEEFDNADLNAIATEASETDAPSLFVFNLSVGVAEVAEAALGDLKFREAQTMGKATKSIISSISTLRTRANNLSNFDVAELAELDTIAEWPQPVRQFLLLGTLLLGLLTGYFYFLSEPRRAIEAAQALEDQLRADFTHKAREASQLDAMKGQVAAIDLAFNGLLRQLPSSAEVPSLVDDITEAGLGYGLEFSRIQLQGETMREFFYELPIEIALVGSYHDFGMFVSGVASLGRIVTLHDFKIDSSAEKGQKMRLLARTYRYDEKFVSTPSVERESTDGVI